MTAEHVEDDISNIVIGPSPERERRAREESRERERRTGQSRRELLDKFEFELEEKYGEQLISFGGAYFRSHDSGFANVKGRGRVKLEEVRLNFAAALTQQIEQQPIEMRARWTADLFKDLERLNHF